ncbi:MAG: hypothetical protein K6A39_06865, partial [Clostridiales bacterium]|nr:hypothetical protein [Clostridiales bacterium]
AHQGHAEQEQRRSAEKNQDIRDCHLVDSSFTHEVYVNPIRFGAERKEEEADGAGKPQHRPERNMAPLFRQMQLHRNESAVTQRMGRTDGCRLDFIGRH